MNYLAAVHQMQTIRIGKWDTGSIWKYCNKISLH